MFDPIYLTLSGVCSVTISTNARELCLYATSNTGRAARSVVPSARSMDNSWVIVAEQVVPESYTLRSIVIIGGTRARLPNCGGYFLNSLPWFQTNNYVMPYTPYGKKRNPP